MEWRLRLWFEEEEGLWWEEPGGPEGRGARGAKCAPEPWPLEANEEEGWWPWPWWPPWERSSLWLKEEEVWWCEAERECPPKGVLRPVPPEPVPPPTTRRWWSMMPDSEPERFESASERSESPVELAREAELGEFFAPPPLPPPVPPPARLITRDKEDLCPEADPEPPEMPLGPVPLAEDGAPLLPFLREAALLPDGTDLRLVLPPPEALPVLRGPALPAR